MGKKREDLPLSENLKRCGITKISKEGEHVLLVIEEKVVLFRISTDGIYSTLENFRKSSRSVMDLTTQQAIIILLYVDFFQFDNKKKDDPSSKQIGRSTRVTDAALKKISSRI
jgi:hypothetical protein